MYTHKEYEAIKGKHGLYSSWAIWDNENIKNTSIIDGYFQQLGVRYVFIGLNIAKQLTKTPWSNFHGGKHDRKLKKACNDTKLRGSYLTDIFKDIPESKSVNLKKYIDGNMEVLRTNVAYFNREMEDIKIDKETVFIILGTESSIASKYFKTYFYGKYGNQIVNYYHHSYFQLTDDEWVDGLWKTLSIK